MDGKKNYLSIGESSEYLGVSIDTLRRWEKKGRINPYRSPGGHRYYERDELDKLFGKRYVRDETKEPGTSAFQIESATNPIEEIPETHITPAFIVQPPRPFPPEETPPLMDSVRYFGEAPEVVKAPTVEPIPLHPAARPEAADLIKPVVPVIEEIPAPAPIDLPVREEETIPSSPQPVNSLAPQQKEIRIPTVEPIRITSRQPETPVLPIVDSPQKPITPIVHIEHKPESSALNQTVYIPEIKPETKPVISQTEVKIEPKEHKPLLNNPGILVPQALPKRESAPPEYPIPDVKKENSKGNMKETIQIILIVAVLALVIILGVVLFYMLWSSSRSVLSPSP